MTLIERLEAAETGSRELDALIGYEIDFASDDLRWRETVDRAGMEGALKRANSYQNIWSTALPHFSTSIDSALTLIRDGMEIRLDRVVGPNGWEHCCDLCGDGVTRDQTDSKAATLPLAICIASLKARSGKDG